MPEARKRSTEGAAGVAEALALESYTPYLFSRLSNRWELDQNRALAAYGLNSTMMRILSVLSGVDSLTINELSVFAIAEQSSTSRTVNQMVEAGLVSRSVEEGDQRRRAVMLTPAGLERLRQADPLIRENVDRLIDGISPKDLEICNRVLARMMYNIRQNQI
ncbi:MAG: MarR family transcriptional regulator [Rhodobacteraceae bacterium]|nr:MarR family transcriptional regulator [Paracoccaceae bacterium]